jgi:hypothetical protein
MVTFANFLVNKTSSIAVAQRRAILRCTLFSFFLTFYTKRAHELEKSNFLNLNTKSAKLMSST